MRTSFESVLKSKNLAHLDRASRAGLTVPVRRVSFILREHFSMMAFTGAVDALVTANLMSSLPLFEVKVVGGAQRLVVSDIGISISTDCTLEELDEKAQDILVVCGGFRVVLEPDPRLRAKLRAADVVDLLVTVGALGRLIGEEALASGMDPERVQLLDDDQEAVAFLRQGLQAGDLVLVKGSRAVGMDQIVAKILVQNQGPGASA